MILNESTSWIIMTHTRFLCQVWCFLPRLFSWFVKAWMDTCWRAVLRIGHGHLKMAGDHRRWNALYIRSRQFIAFSFWKAAPLGKPAGGELTKKQMNLEQLSLAKSASLGIDGSDCSRCWKGWVVNFGISVIIAQGLSIVNILYLNQI